MHTKTGNIAFVTIIAGVIWLLSFYLNDTLSETMPRHQLIQLPAMLLTGIVSGLWFRRHLRMDVSSGIAVFIVAMSSLIFWMLPRSIDLAVIKPSFNRVMHLNMIVVGFFLLPAFRNMIFEVRIIFLGMISAMLAAVGIALTSFDILLCSAFDVFQQKYTGQKLIIIGVALFATTLFTFFKGLGTSNNT